MVPIGIAKITDEEDDTMATDLRIALDELLHRAQMDRDADFLREGVRVLAQALMELEVTQHLGAECWRTRAGTIPREPGKRISSG